MAAYNRYMQSAVDACDMGDDTSIRVSEELADELYQRKGRSTSYEDFIWELLERVEADNTQQTHEPAPEPIPESTPEPEATLDELVGRVGREVLPGSGEKLDKRVDALHATVEYLKEHGQATPADFKREVYPQHTGMYVEGSDPPRSWWKNAIYKGMSELAEQSDEIEAAGTDGQWRYVAETDG